MKSYKKIFLTGTAVLLINLLLTTSTEKQKGAIQPFSYGYAELY